MNSPHAATRISIHGWLPPFGLGAAALTVYGLTAARGYSWLNNGVDGGDLLAAALTNGVAHPSGYPLYGTLLRAVGVLFPANPAFAANLLNALVTSITGVLFYFFLLNRFKAAKVAGPYAILASLSVSGMYLVAPLVWSHATITEVYPLHMLLLTFLLHLTDSSSRPQTIIKQNFLIGMVFGLALSNHLTSIFALPLLLPTEQVVANKKDGYRAFVLRVAIGLLVAFGLYSSLLFTSPTAAIRWNDPMGFRDLFALVSGAIYHSYVTVPNDFTLNRLFAVPGLLVEQVGAFGLFLGLWGMAYTSRRTYRELAIISFGVAALLFSLLYPVYDSYVHLLPFVLVFCVWVADGLIQLGNLAKGTKAEIALVGVLVVNILFGVPQNWASLNISNDTSAEDFARAALKATPPSAVLLASRDKELFALWYVHEGLGERPDVTVIAENLAQMVWYQRLIERNRLPIHIPGQAGANAWRLANPKTTICEVVSIDPALLNCAATP